MDARTLAETLADPIGTVGMSFYFSPQAITVGETIELDVVTFYAAGRGGVLGDIEVDEVDETFYFFNPGLVASMMTKARSTTERSAAVAAHLAAADAFAHATFGGIAPEVLSAFDDAAAALFATTPRGVWPLVDGYLACAVPTDLTNRAYFYAVVLRELRGGVHTDAVKAAGLSAAAACQLDRGGAYFGLHGYGDEHRVDETPELVAARAAAEDATSAGMAELLGVLDDDQRNALAEGATALFGALSSPVPVA
jgi:hypothetical protein